MSEDDLKKVLAIALADEPPSHLTSEEALKAGRARLRGRRFSSVVAVALVVVGAVFAVSLATAVPHSATPAIDPSPPADCVGGTSCPPRKQSLHDPVRAATLDEVIFDSGVLPKDFAYSLVGDAGSAAYPDRSEPRDYQLLYRAEGPDGRVGSVSVEIGVATTAVTRPDCGGPISCETRWIRGLEVLFTTSSQGDGDAAVVLVTAYADQADGSRVMVISCNHEPPTGGPVVINPGWQPLDLEQLGNLVTLPGLEF
ncbi:hypothetical protein [Umezawaea tangerina]|uniref:Uncharacterized protein n=1 Tax=Umezawaea tangerina TaxID=84725 RepID=A0A2T0SH40_9PSEU|nr:hypothetical protein [Umezawaea tangerina]PRY32717.1 hypothetical protein CLV43_120136 [Umezawaea tangerina]